jgi:aspartate aminotransferase
MTMKVTALAAELRARGTDVVSLSAGEPDFDTPAHVKEAAKRALDAGATKYTAVEGTPELRAAVAAWFAKAHGFDVAPAEVMVSAGAKQAIHNAFHALLDPGDEVILPAPCWVSYAEIAKLAGATPVPVLSRAQDGFAIDPAAIARVVTKATRMIVLCSPSNPTGAVCREATLRALADLACRHDLWLLTDDIYRGLCYGGVRCVQPATLQGQSTTNAAAPSQAAALAALEGPQDDLERMRLAFDERRQLMVRALRNMPGVTCVEPQGSFYAFPDISAFLGKRSPQGRKIEDDVALGEYLLETARVAVVPGSAFFAPGFVRLSYATSRENIEKGLSRMAQALAALK